MATHTKMCVRYEG